MVFTCRELRKVNKSEVQFSTHVRRMAIHGCVENDISLFIFVIVVLFFQNHLSSCLSGQKISREKKKKPWKKF